MLPRSMSPFVPLSGACHVVKADAARQVQLERDEFAAVPVHVPGLPAAAAPTSAGSAMPRVIRLERIRRPREQRALTERPHVVGLHANLHEAAAFAPPGLADADDVAAGCASNTRRTSSRSMRAVVRRIELAGRAARRARASTRRRRPSPRRRPSGRSVLRTRTGGRTDSLQALIATRSEHRDAAADRPTRASRRMIYCAPSVRARRVRCPACSSSTAARRCIARTTRSAG